MSTSESKSALVLELAEEFLERYRQGQRPSLKEYIHRHPELAAEIKEVFPAMALMENVALADESLVGAATGPATLTETVPPQQLGDYRILREGRPRRHGHRLRGRASLAGTTRRPQSAATQNVCR